MSDAFELIPVHTHSKQWIARLRAAASICPGKDPEDTRCTCPDIVYATRVRVRDGTTLNYHLYCGCCDLPLADPSV